MASLQRMVEAKCDQMGHFHCTCNAIGEPHTLNDCAPVWRAVTAGEKLVPFATSFQASAWAKIDGWLYAHPWKVTSHAIEHDRWMIDHEDPEYLWLDKRWCRVCGRLDRDHETADEVQ